MVDTARRMNVPFLAGSSLPVTWRLPAVEVPLGAGVAEVMCVGYGPKDAYDYHAYETLQCLAERRRGGETGVAAVQAVGGPGVWEAVAAGPAKELFEACLSRSQTLAQPETFSHRYPTPEQVRAFAREPRAYRVEYADGTRGTVLMLNGLVQDFTAAARLASGEVLSALFYLPPNPNVTYSAALMAKAEELFRTGRPPYPVERTLLTSGLVAAGLRSLADGPKRLATPHLAAVTYQPPKESQFLRQ